MLELIEFVRKAYVDEHLYYLHTQEPINRAVALPMQIRNLLRQIS